MTSIQGTCIIQLKSCNKHSFFFTLHDMINKNSLELELLKYCQIGTRTIV